MCEFHYRGSGFASLAEKREEIDDAFASKFNRSTSNSRAKRVDRKSEHRRWYERDEIASQYLYCIKDPPCHTCCRYNETLFRTVLEYKGKCPPQKHKTTDYPHSKSRIHHRQHDAETGKCDMNPFLRHHGVRSSDVTASTRRAPPLHQFHSDASLPWCGRKASDVAKPSDAACRGSGPPSTDYYCGVAATGTVNGRKLPPAVAWSDGVEKGRPKTDGNNFNVLPPRNREGISRYDGVPIGKSIADPSGERVPLSRGDSGKLLRPVNSRSASSLVGRRPPLSQPTSPKFQPKSTGEASWRRREEKQFICGRSPESGLRTKHSIANGCAQKLQTDCAVPSVSKPFYFPKTGKSSLYFLSRTSEGNRCTTESAAAQSLVKRPALSPSADRTVWVRDSSGKRSEPPPINRRDEPPGPASRVQTISPILLPSAQGRSRDTERLGRRIIFKNPPSKPCNLSCFDQSNRTRDFDTSYDKPCILPDIFDRRNNLNPSPRPHDNTMTSDTPFWKVAANTSSPWRSSCSRSSYGRLRDTAHSNARWREALDRDVLSGRPKSQKRMYGKAEWKKVIE